MRQQRLLALFLVALHAASASATLGPRAQECGRAVVAYLQSTDSNRDDSRARLTTLLDASLLAGIESDLAIVRGALGEGFRAHDTLWETEDEIAIRCSDAAQQRWTALIVSIASPRDGRIVSIGLRRSAPPSEVPSLDTRRRLFAEILEQINRGYVIEGARPKLSAVLREWLESTDQHAGLDAAGIATRLTEDLRRAHPDKHLRVLNPAELEARTRDHSDAATPGRDAPESLHHNYQHHGIEQAFVRTAADGEGPRVGTVRLSAMDGSPEAIDAWVDAVQRLAPIDALLLDLRGNRGGDAGMPLAIASSLLPNGTHILSREVLDPTTQTRTVTPVRTAENALTAALINTRVVVLTDRFTASAAESLAFALQTQHRATVIGEPTAGAGHSVETVPLAGGFGLVLPTGRSFDPATGNGWEIAGVRPDTLCDPDHAESIALDLLGAG